LDEALGTSQDGDESYQAYGETRFGEVMTGFAKYESSYSHMRRPIKKRPEVKPDARYGSVEVERLINYIMLRGQKETARKIVYGAFEEIKNAKEHGGDPVEIFETALRNAGPQMEVRSRRVGGANYQVPREVRPERRTALALRWIVNASRGQKGVPMFKSLANELMLAAREEGAAVKKKEDTHRMAEANRAFAHFAF
jgi:small subunit ribosomal protein S7